MSYPSGIGAQLVMGVETTYGTRATSLDRVLEFVSESLRMTIRPVESKALQAGKRSLRSDRWALGQRDVSGTIVHELQSKGLGVLFEHMLGDIATSQPNAGEHPTVFEHKAIQADPAGLAMSIQVGRPDIDGTCNPFDYYGAKIASWRISGKVGEVGLLEITWNAQDEDTEQDLEADPTYLTTELLIASGAGVTIASVDYPVESFAVQYDCGLNTNRYVVGTNLKREPIADKPAVITLQLDGEYLSNTAYARLASGSMAAVALNFEGSVISGTYKNAVELTFPKCRTDGDTPVVGGSGVLPLSLKMSALDDGTATAPIQILYRTTDSTP